jgi:hypothetical protein
MASSGGRRAENERVVTPLFQKLNLKEQPEIVVCNAPAAFDAELARLKDVKVVRDPPRPKAVRFAIAFATRQNELDRLSTRLAAAAEGDAVLWFAYPKGTSKRYACEFNRDTGWDVIRGQGFESVRQVAIDDDWSALRFRRKEFVKPTARR